MKQLPITLIAALSIGGCNNPASLSSLPAQSNATGSSATTALRFKVFTAGQTPGFPASASAFDIAAGPSGTIWFTDDGTPAIGRIAADGTFTEFTAGLPPGAVPYAIAAGPDGNMWFSDSRGVAIGRVTPSGAITEFSLSQYTDTKAMSIAFVRGKPWFVGFGVPSLLVRLSPGGTLLVRKLPGQFTPSGSLAADTHANLFFTGNNIQLRAELFERPRQAQKFIRFPMHMHLAEVICCPNRAPRQMVIGPDGNPWFTTIDWAHKNSAANYLGTFRTDTVRLARITRRGLSETAYPSGISAGSNSLWITGSDPFAAKGAIWHIDLQGNQKAYDLPYNPLGLAVDGTGRPWFTAFESGSPSEIVEVLSH